MSVDLSAPDVLATDGLCSLREAIINANDDAATWPDCPTGVGDDEILLSEGVFYAASSGPSLGSDLYVMGNLDLLGLGADRSVIDGGTVVAGAGASVAVTALAIQNAFGCGIENQGDSLAVDRVAITGTRGRRCGRVGCPWLNGAAVCSYSGGANDVSNSSLTDNAAGIGGVSGAFLVRNSTIAANQFGVLGFGVLGGGSIRHSTIADNEVGFFGSVSLEASIVARNEFGCGAGAVSLGYNLDDDGTCGFAEATDLPNTDPRLGFLSSHAVPFIPVLAGSPAIDAIPPGDCTETADQQGVPRPRGAGCDIGASEWRRRTCGLGFDV